MLEIDIVPGGFTDSLMAFLWVAVVATTPPLTEDDPLRDCLYDGLGRHPGMSSLFGLKLRPGDPEPFEKIGADLREDDRAARYAL
jgi:hypothetical protein